MSGAMHSYIRPHSYIVLRLSSGMLKVLEIQPNTNISIGKFGTFSANLLLGRPYYLTYEVAEESNNKVTALRVVPPSELHEDALQDSTATPAESRDEKATPAADGGVEFDIVGEDGTVLMRNNRLTVDDPSRQKLTQEEIEELKKAGQGSGKEIIEKIMAAHQALNEKTKFSLSKYTLRKTKKYLKRFTVFPMTPSMLSEVLLEREAPRILELREEHLGLLGSWANIHYGDPTSLHTAPDGQSKIGGGRWLVVDDTGGLLVASLAEKMGILYPEFEDDESEEEEEAEETSNGNVAASVAPGTNEDVDMAEAEADSKDQEKQEQPAPSEPQHQEHQPSTTTAEPTGEPPAKRAKTTTNTPHSHPRSTAKVPARHAVPAMSSTHNSITILHANAQPNLGLLKYFGFDPSLPQPTHPLHTHLKSLSWLQLLDPSAESGFEEPAAVPDELLRTWKSGKRGTYYRKRRRWERVVRVVRETRAGGFDGLALATALDPASVLNHALPLLRGGAPVVVYSPAVEPAAALMDLYSKERRAAFLERRAAEDAATTTSTSAPASTADVKTAEEGEPQDTNVNPAEAAAGIAPLRSHVPTDDFPVNPTLLLGTTLQTARVRPWQVLPGRTHPMMTSRGGAEGYFVTATRVLPVEGRIEARGKYGKKRKTEVSTTVPATTTTTTPAAA